METGVKDTAFNEYYNKIYKEYVINAIQRITNDNQDMDVGKLLSLLYDEFFSMNQCDTTITVQDWMRHVLQETQDRKNNKIPDIFIPSGYNFIDTNCGGWCLGDVYVIVARPGGGKTALMINIAKKLFKNNIPVLISSIEESHDSIYTKMMCSELHIDTRLARQRLFTNKQEVEIVNLFTRWDEKKIYVDQENDFYIEDARQKVRSHIKRHNIKAWMIDYLQICETYDKNLKEYEQIKKYMKVIKSIAIKEKIPVFILAQADRGLDDPNKTPTMKDIYGGSQVEKTADWINILKCNSKIDNDPNSNNYMLENWIVKNRWGISGKAFRLNWNKSTCNIKDY
jgi:replicative DNA helicase